MPAALVPRAEEWWVAYLEELTARELRHSAVARFDVRSYRQVLESHTRPRPLTPRQRALLELVGRGLRDTEIADHMGISPATIKKSIRLLKARLRVNGRAELAEVAHAVRRGHFSAERMTWSPTGR